MTLQLFFFSPPHYFWHKGDLLALQVVDRANEYRHLRTMGTEERN